MFKMSIIKNQTISVTQVGTEIRVLQTGIFKETIFLKMYKEHELLDALVRYDELVLAARIEADLKAFKHSKKEETNGEKEAL